MKKSYFAYLLPIILSSCVEDISMQGKENETEISTRSSGQEGDLFYYYFDEKVYLTQRTDQVFLKFASDATKEQLHAVAQSNTLSQKVNTNENLHFVEGYDFNTLIIEPPQSADALTSLKARKEIVSATYMLDNNGKMSAYTDEFSVKLKRGTSFAQLRELAKNNNCIVNEHEWFGENEFMVTVSKTSDLDAVGMACLFYETELFEFTAPNFVSFNALDSYDTHFYDQWNLKSTGQYNSYININIEQAWAITQGSSNIKVAVLDTGVDLTHDDLQANLLAGYDATGGGSAGAFVYNNGWGNDVSNSHGTAVAGIIGAIKDNNKGISGVAPGCEIIPIRVGMDGYVQDSWAVAAFNWARTRADVINCSWGGAQANAQLTSAINNAATQGRNNKGCVVVFATGNDDSSQINYQAALPNVIGVGAVSLNGQRKSLSSPDGEQWGSNYGTGIDVVAPGVLIPTTDIQEFRGYNWDWNIHPNLGGNKRASDYSDRDYTVWFGGTSAATPHVSGIAALILSVYPTLTQTQVADMITSSASNNSWSSQTGWGLVNAHKALLASFVITGPENPLYNTNTVYKLNSLTSVTGVSVNWSVLPSGSATISGSGNSRTIKFLVSGANCTVQARITTPSGKAITVSKVVSLKPHQPMISHSGNNGMHSTNLYPGGVLIYNVTNSHPDATYDWDIIQGDLSWNVGSQICLTCPTTGYGGAYSSYIIVRCRSLIGGVYSDWSQHSYVMLGYLLGL